MVPVAQLVRVPDCDSGGRRFDPDLTPKYDKIDWRGPVRARGDGEFPIKCVWRSNTPIKQRGVEYYANRLVGYGAVAQLVERPTEDEEVADSVSARSTTRLWQTIQSLSCVLVRP